MSGVRKVKKPTGRVRDPRTGKFKRAAFIPVASPASAPIPLLRPDPVVAPRPPAQRDLPIGLHNVQRDPSPVIDWEDKCRKYVEYCDSLLNRYRALKTSNRDLERQIRNLQKLRRTEKTLQDLERDIKSRNKALNAVEARLEPLEEREQLEDDKEELEEKVDELEGENHELEEQVEELEGEKEELEEQVEELEGEKEELEGQVEELEAEKEELERSLICLEHYKAVEGPLYYGEWNSWMAAEVAAKWENRLNSRYRRVKVLLVQWASDDLGVSAEIQGLAAVFTNQYEFDVSRFLLPDYQPSTVLMQRVMEFMDHDPETLLIFYYAGHGGNDPQRNETYWAATSAPHSPSMPSGSIQTLLEETRSDAILFYDCCHSADTARTKSTLQGITELVAACGFQTTAPGVGPTSFTHALTKALTEFHKAAKQFSVSALFTTVLADLRGAQGRTDQTAPVHCSLTSEQTGRHIMLAPANAPDAKIIFSNERDVVTII